MDQETSGSEQDSSKSVKEAVEQVKQRIIATGKLMKYLQNAKKGECKYNLNGNALLICL
jgi:Zn/Cd-binding protein ZinT